MEILVRGVVGILLVAHGLVHLLYFVEDVPEFSLEGSWALSASAERTVGLTLAVATVAAFGLTALAVWGVPGLASAWPVVTVVAAVVSLAMLVTFWDKRLLVGVAIDVLLIVLALWRPDWTEQVG